MPTGCVNSRRIALIALCLAALAASGAPDVMGSAQVHPRMTIKVKREVGRDIFKGRIRAKDDACSSSRNLRLVIRKPSREKRRAGSVRTNGSGRWRFVPKPIPGDKYADEGERYADPGEWRAKVRQDRVGGVNCSAGKTGPIHVG